MDTNLFTLSPSPHIKQPKATKDMMRDVVIALLPATIVSVLFFGLGAVKVLFVAVIFCMLFEFLIQKFLLKGSITITDNSAIITGVLLAFNLPSNIPIWMIIVGCLVAIGVGKMTFGGLGKNPFNPALVGRVFLLISFPVEMTSWPKPRFLAFDLTTLDGKTGATVLGIMKEGVGTGKSVAQLMAEIPHYTDLFIGRLGGSLGEVSAAALILGGIFLLARRVISWHIPISFIVSLVALTGILHLYNPSLYADPLFHLLSGGLLLGAIFMATDYVTSPMSSLGMIVFGVGCGVLTVVIRTFGAYPEGVSFAILIMNAFTPLIDRYLKPQRFGVK